MAFGDIWFKFVLDKLHSCFSQSLSVCADDSLGIVSCRFSVRNAVTASHLYRKQNGPFIYGSWQPDIILSQNHLTEKTPRLLQIATGTKAQLIIHLISVSLTLHLFTFLHLHLHNVTDMYLFLIGPEGMTL